MAKRYRRTIVDVFQKRDVPLAQFPVGEGPPVYVTAFGPEWTRLAIGQGVGFELADQAGGAFAWGLTSTLVAIWVHALRDGSARAFCQHLPHGPIDPSTHAHACAEIGFDRFGDPLSLRVVLAGRRDVTEDDERPFVRLGVLPDRLITYSNALLSQFGVSRRGFVGEAG